VDELDRRPQVVAWYRQFASAVLATDLGTDGAWSPERVVWALKDVLAALREVCVESGDEPRAEALYDLHYAVRYAAVTWREQREHAEAAERRAATVDRRRQRARQQQRP